jgi:Na+(H+)/acetate symporter ActP
MTVSTGAVIGLLFMASVTLVVGIFARRYAHTTSDLFVAARAVSPRLNAAAISGEYLSAASFLGVAGLVMQFGYDVLWYPVGYAAGYLVLLIFIAGPLRRFGAYTIPDFAEGRFNSARFRRLAVVLVIVIGTFYALPQMKAAGITVATAAGVPYAVGVVAVAAVVGTIVTAGGMRGITLVQAVQYAAKMFGISVPLFFLLIHFGGAAQAFATASSQSAPVLPAATTFSVQRGDIWTLPAPVLLTTSHPVGVELVAVSSQSGPTYVGVPLQQGTPNASTERTISVAGSTTLPSGRLMWQGNSQVTIAAGQAAPFGSQTPVSSGASWARPFGPLAGGSGSPLLFTYSLIIAIVCGTMGLPHILVRFYTNRDARAARRTACYVLCLVSVFYLFPPLYGALGRLGAPDLYTSNLTDAVVLVLPRRIDPSWLGQMLAAIVAAGAFAAFASTLSGLMVSLASAMGHDVYGRWLRPAASPQSRARAFKVGAVGVATAVALLGLLVEQFDISILVGWAFAIAASSFFPLLVLGIWWRGLTVAGAAIGSAVGGLVATGAIVLTMVSFVSPSVAAFYQGHSTLAVLLAQPAIVTVPIAFSVMVVISLARRRLPVGVRTTMLHLHAPDRLGLSRDYIPD